MSLTAAAQLLKTSLVLLAFISAHSELPQSTKDNAMNVARGAISQATQVLATAGNSPVATFVANPAPSPTPIPTPNPTPAIIATANASAATTPQSNTFSAPSPAQAVDVFLIAGQSNAVGITEDPSRASLPSIPANTTYQYYGGSSGTDSFCNATWTTGLTMISGTNPITPGHCGNAWSQFAITYNQLTHRPIVFVPAAVAGSALIASIQSYVGAPDNWQQGGGNLFGNATTYTSQAMLKLQSSNFQPTFRGILWIQGESDALAISGGKVTRDQYEIALRATIQNFRNEFHDQNMPFYIFQIGTNTAYYPHDADSYGQIRRADNDVEDPSNHIYVVSREALTFPERGMLHDTVHYNQLGYNEIGKVGAQNVVAVQNGGLPDHPADSVASIVTNPGHTVIYGGFVNRSNSCDSSTYALSYGDNSADDIVVPAGMCGPYFFHTTHTYAAAGSYTFRLDTTSVASHHAGNPYTVVSQGTYNVQ